MESHHHYNKLLKTVQVYENRLSYLNAFIHLNDIDDASLIWSNKSFESFLEHCALELSQTDSTAPQLKEVYGLDDLRQLSLETVKHWFDLGFRLQEFPMNKNYVLQQHQGSPIFILELVVPHYLNTEAVAPSGILGISIHLNIGIASQSPLEQLLKENAQLKYQLQIALLSPKEREVLQLIAQGNSTMKIAEILQKSRNTIETHRKKLLTKLNCKNMAELASFATQAGLY